MSIYDLEKCLSPFKYADCQRYNVLFRTLTKDDAPWDDPYKRRSRVITAAGKSTGIPTQCIDSIPVFIYLSTV